MVIWCSGCCSQCLVFNLLLSHDVWKENLLEPPSPFCQMMSDDDDARLTVGVKCFVCVMAQVVSTR
jgi:hypothetical protein